MSKESLANGLHRRFHKGESKDTAAVDETPRQGTFVPEALDKVRLLSQFQNSPRRM